MDKKILDQVNGENADMICAKIRQDTENEVKGLLDRASREKDGMIKKAEAEAQKKANDIRREADKDIDKSRERINSTLNLEKKRLLLEGKNRFVQSVFGSVAGLAEKFREQPAYADYLQKWIIEGIRVIESDKVDLFYSFRDENIVSDVFIRKIENICKDTLKQNVSIKPCKGDFTDIGVIVNSRDARVMFDNRFSARLSRSYDQVYMELLKEVSFG
ncbi:MAG: V-type ATP synthase subunit E [Candidatus Omnitrophica bacterium]|nr:V-type ATP synthase subunit E [Candidatus Omnitrophota bacterium]MDD5079533.1 V-type ATP synthase subunit E [Candidatus Omnitrophota bacterium]